ncbi:hypothetical protein CPER28S_01645 [Cellulomonas persica]
MEKRSLSERKPTHNAQRAAATWPEGGRAGGSAGGA